MPSSLVIRMRMGLLLPLAKEKIRHPEVPAEGGPRRMHGHRSRVYPRSAVFTRRKSGKPDLRCRRPSRRATRAPQGDGERLLHCALSIFVTPPIYSLSTSGTAIAPLSC